MTLSEKTKHNFKTSISTCKTLLKAVFVKNIKTKTNHYQLHIWCYENITLRREYNYQKQAFVDVSQNRC